MPERATQDRWAHEVRDLHRFFEDWLNGRAEKTEAAYARFREALAEGFEMVTPAGKHLTRDALLASFRETHGRHAAEPLAIEVRHVAVSPLAPNLVAVTYEEWHTTAGEETGRRSTAVLGASPDPGGQPVWIRVQETWIQAPQG